MTRIASTVATQILSGLILTCTVGAICGALAIFYPAMCWFVLVLIALLTVKHKQPPTSRAEVPIIERWPYLVMLATTCFVCWPSAIFPPTDGDTLIYHLPNVGTWLWHHSLWSTDTRYWWYPPASELTAATLMSVAGLPVLPLVGASWFFALTAIVYEALLSVTSSKTFSTWCALALATSHVAIVQAGDLQNDVALAALSMSVLSFREQQLSPLPLFAIATALTKPDGWLYAFLALIFSKARKRVFATTAVATVAWAAAVFVLARWGDVVPLPPPRYAVEFETSIVAHGFAGLETLITSAGHDSASTLAFLAFSFGSLGLVHRSRYARYAVAALIFWLVMPNGFESGGVPQLALGYSLRFGLPAMSAAALVIGEYIVATRLKEALLVAAGVVCFTLFVLNMYEFYRIYAPFSSGTFMIPAGLIVAVLCALLIALRTALPARLGPIALATAVVGLISYAFVQRHRVDLESFYQYRFPGPSGRALLRAIDDFHGNTLATYHFPAGIATVLRPGLHEVDMPTDGDICAFVDRWKWPLLIREPPIVTVSPPCTTHRLDPNIMFVQRG